MDKLLGACRCFSSSAWCRCDQSSCSWRRWSRERDWIRVLYCQPTSFGCARIVDLSANQLVWSWTEAKQMSFEPFPLPCRGWVAQRPRPGTCTPQAACFDGHTRSSPLGAAVGDTAAVAPKKKQGSNVWLSISIGIQNVRILSFSSHRLGSFYTLDRQFCLLFSLEELLLAAYPSWRFCQRYNSGSRPMFGDELSTCVHWNKRAIESLFQSWILNSNNMLRRRPNLNEVQRVCVGSFFSFCKSQACVCKLRLAWLKLCGTLTNLSSYSIPQMQIRHLVTHEAFHAK